MVLDEATSALDATTETRLQQALEAARRGCTTFVIAHRLATIRNADLILVFDEGRIVKSGPFDALVEKGGAFAALARAQFMTSPAAGARSRGNSIGVSVVRQVEPCLAELRLGPLAFG